MPYIQLPISYPTMNPIKIITFTLLLSTSLICKAEEIAILDLQFERVTKPNDNLTPIKSECTVIVEKPSDQRANIDNLGATFLDKPVVSKLPVLDWLESGLLNLKTLGLNTINDSNPSAANQPKSVRLSSNLQKLYVWQLGLNLHATVALQTKITNLESGLESTQNYRVVGTKLNWWGADSELATTVNIAMNRLLEQVASDVSKQCNTSKNP